ncbi:14850_t:CDS:2, partial [Dentiscutata heterogama]
ARLEQIDPPIHDRSLLKVSSNPPTDVHSKYFTIKSAQNLFSGRNPVPVTTKIFHFSDDVLKRLRDYYSVGTSNENWISTNDALVAHLWRTCTRARNLDLNTEVSSPQIRKAVTDVNESHVRSITVWVEQQPDKSLIQVTAGYDGKYFGGSSWAKFQKHDLIDFGDGTPIKQRRPGKTPDLDGLFMILGAEDGVDVYLTLQIEKLEILEQDSEFKKFIIP